MFNGKPATLLNWLCLWGAFAIFCVLLYQGLLKTWGEHGIPRPMQAYLRWEKQHCPKWWVNLFVGD